MSKVPSISFSLGLMTGIISMAVYMKYSLVSAVITLVLSFLIFELYKRYYAGEPDFVMHFDKADLEKGEDVEKFFKDIFEEKNKEDN
ncbi:MAG: hypothetical protein ACOCV1_07780 [Bacillota bacterium]